MEHFNLLILRLLFLTNFLQFTSYACFAKRQTNPTHQIVINTWNFKSAGEEAWRVLQMANSSALDAVQGRFQNYSSMLRLCMNSKIGVIYSQI